MSTQTPHWLVCVFAAAIALCNGSSSFARVATIDLPVPKITIYPGDTISGELLSVKSFRADAGRLPVIRSNAEAIGKVARRTLIAGKPIPASHIRDAELVKQGKPVRIVFSQGSMVISGVAIPLQSGGLGDMLSLRNIDSGTIIKGIVEEDGTVRIAGP
jgi:flagella basal body P-ring formation protein FlgA